MHNDETEGLIVVDRDGKRANGVCEMRRKVGRGRFIKAVDEFLGRAPLVTDQVLYGSGDEFSGDELAIVLDLDRVEELDEVADVDSVQVDISDELGKGLLHRGVSREFLLEG